MDYDVVIVGASIAGCTAATLYGRAGQRVALLEKHRDPATFKALCGHFVLGGTRDMLVRTGLWDELVAAGAFVGGMSLWTGAGWVAPPDGVPPAVNLRRERLDPLLRKLAGDTPGVHLVLGRTVTDLLTEGERVVGVRARDLSGTLHEYRGRLVVGADGHRSTVAELASVPQDRSPNNRFAMWAYYRGVTLANPTSQLWQIGADFTITGRTDDGLTTVVAFPGKSRLNEFRDDRAAALERYVTAVPDPPNFSGAERVSKVVGMTDYPCVRRDPTPRPGLMLVGDAAVTGDPAPAVGCGWAFRGAEWLVDSTLPALRGEVPERAARRAYRSRLRFVLDHDAVSRTEALAGPPGRMQRLVMAATARDPELGRRAYLYGMRAIPVSGLRNPGTVGRALVAMVRGGRR